MNSGVQADEITRYCIAQAFDYLYNDDMNNVLLEKTSEARFKHFLILLIAALTAIAPILAHGQELSNQAHREVQVIRVHDGDTVTLLINGRLRKARLIGMDAPEMNQRPWGRRAKEHLIEILDHTGWTAAMKTDVVTTDKDGRSLVYLWSRDNEMINERMVLDGYAVMFTIKPNNTYADRFRKAELNAREKKKGIWGPDGLKEKPIEYKKKHPRMPY